MEWTEVVLSFPYVYLFNLVSHSSPMYICLPCFTCTIFCLALSAKKNSHFHVSLLPFLRCKHIFFDCSSYTPPALSLLQISVLFMLLINMVTSVSIVRTDYDVQIVMILKMSRVSTAYEYWY